MFICKLVHIIKVKLLKVPRIGSVKVYSENLRRDEILIDLELLYAGDASIKIETKGILAGIKDIQVKFNVFFTKWKKFQTVLI